MGITNTSYSATVTELQQPHRYDWVAVCNGNPPCGWQSHAHNSPSEKGEPSADAVGMIVYHMMGKHGYDAATAAKAVKVVNLTEPKVQVPLVPPVPAQTDQSRLQSAKPQAGITVKK